MRRLTARCPLAQVGQRGTAIMDHAQIGSDTRPLEGPLHLPDSPAIIFHQQYGPAVHDGSLVMQTVGIVPASRAVDNRSFVRYMT